MDVNAFRSALHALEFAGFEGGSAARVLGTALRRVETASRAPSLTRISAHQLESSFIGTQAVLQRAVAAGVGNGVTTHHLGAAHAVAATMLLDLRSGTFEASAAIALLR